MFDLDKVTIKRKIIACIVLSLPVIYYVVVQGKTKAPDIFTVVFHCLLYGVAFLFIVAVAAGIIAVALLIVYGVVLLLGTILLGTKPEIEINLFIGIGYVSIGIALILLYYFIFSGHFPQVIF